MKRTSSGFTLVELLVVVGIIALLISILLPSLNRAREAARNIKCSANLRSIGAGIEIYKVDYKGMFPAAYTYAGKYQQDVPAYPTAGYVHWSSYLFGRKQKNDTDQQAYKSTEGWQAFVCPSMGNAGLPPTNTYPANQLAGIPNDAPGDVIDQQAPRLSYTVNEALMPRNKFKINQDKSGNPRVCRYVNAGSVRNNANVVLATEFNPNEKVVVDKGDVSDGDVIKSHRPVHAFLGSGTGAAIHRAGFGTGLPGIYRNWSGLTPGYCENYAPDANNPLTWIGRVHGPRQAGGATSQDLRKTNFLYVDGHVETKRLGETMYPNWQWGEKFYSVSPNDDMRQNDVPNAQQIASF